MKVGIPVMVHVEYASAADGAVMSAFRFEDMADEAILLALSIQREALGFLVLTHCSGTLPGSRLIA